MRVNCSRNMGGKISELSGSEKFDGKKLLAGSLHIRSRTHLHLHSALSHPKIRAKMVFLWYRLVLGCGWSQRGGRRENIFFCMRNHYSKYETKGSCPPVPRREERWRHTQTWQVENWKLQYRHFRRGAKHVLWGCEPKIGPQNEKFETREHCPGDVKNSWKNSRFRVFAEKRRGQKPVKSPSHISRERKSRELSRGKTSSHAGTKKMAAFR